MIEDIKKLEEYQFAKRAHEGQKRKVSGEDYIIHPLAVAKIAQEYGVDESTIKACLLHDVVEDANVSLKEIAEKFGKEIAFLVDGVTKVKNSEFSKKENQEKTLEKIAKYAEKDKRVLLIKLADRIHNMQTIDSRKMQETFKRYRDENPHYIKLGRRLGLNYIANKLCELNFS